VLNYLNKVVWFEVIENERKKENFYYYRNDMCKLC
jgi:hypothetical protein